MRALFIALTSLVVTNVLAQEPTENPAPIPPNVMPQEKGPRPSPPFVPPPSVPPPPPRAAQQHSQPHSPPPPPPQALPPPPPPLPLAGYANGSFFLRDPNDWFVLFPKGRGQIDSYNFLNRGDAPAGVEENGDKDPRPKNTIFVRRARVEAQGTFLGHFDFTIAGEFATTPATGQYGTLSDCYVIIDYLSFLKIQAGQFDLPFTQENRTSDKLFDFMERSIAVRAFAVPSIKDDGVMIFGWMPKMVGYYAVGVFNGDGSAYKNQDNSPAVIGRAFIAPLAWLEAAERHEWLQRIELNGSFWWRDATNLGGFVAPSSGEAQNDLPHMTTQGGVSFFNTSFENGTDGAGNPVRAHLVPWGETTKWSAGADLPIKKVGVRFEFVHQSIELATYNDAPNPTTGLLKRQPGIRGGKLEGFAYYFELYAWLLGDTSFLDRPGLEPVPHIRHFVPAKEPRWGLMVAAKYERLSMNVNGLPSSGADLTGMPVPSPAQGNYDVHAFELGINAWGTKHIRLTANYILNYIDGDAPNVTKNFFYRRTEHELLFRIAAGL